MATRRSAEERREEIVAIAIRHFARGRLQRHLDRGDRARGRHLAAVPVPAVPAPSASCSSPARERCYEQRRRMFARRPPRRARREAEGDGPRLHRAAAARPPRAAVPDAGLRGLRRPGDPRRTCASGFDELRADRVRSWPAYRPTEIWRSSPTGCCSTSSPRSTSGRSPGETRRAGTDARELMLDRRRADPARRRFLLLAGAVVLSPLLGGPASAARHRQRLRRPESEASLARARRSTRATRNGAAPDMVALVRLGAPADSRGRPAQIDRVAGALRDPGIGDVIALRARRRPQRSSRRTGARPTCSPRSPTTAAGARRHDRGRGSSASRA